MIILQNVNKIYRMGTEEVRAMDNVCMHIKTGDFVALRGPSGSGKSTCMNILGCLDRTDDGQYILNGKDVSGLGDDELAAVRNKTIGFVHQNFNLLPRLSALENVELPLVYSGIRRKERLKLARSKLAIVGLAKRSTHMPHQLSGGQQQRVAIARALVNKAPLILADEPTGNLDTKSTVEIMSILARLHERGTTIVLVTHEQDVAEWAQYSITFRDGRISN